MKKLISDFELKNITTNITILEIKKVFFYFYSYCFLSISFILYWCYLFCNLIVFIYNYNCWDIYYYTICYFFPIIVIDDWFSSYAIIITSISIMIKFIFYDYIIITNKYFYINLILISISAIWLFFLIYILKKF